MTEKQVRDIVKSVIKSELSDTPSKDYVKKTIKSELDKLSNNMITKNDVKEVIKDALVKYHKWMWDKKNIWINQI